MITKVASLLIFLASCLFNPSSYATIPDDQFSQANTYYRQGDFQKAYDLYMNIPEKNAAIYYNLGNCAWKLNKNGYALLFWRRAEKNWGIFGKSELLGNIYLVKNKISLSA